MTQDRYWLVVDWIHHHGRNDRQRARIMVGGMGGHIKCFTSSVDKAEERARRWAKKNNIKLQ